MKLFFRKLSSGKPLFILHGLFGSSDNWQTLGKRSLLKIIPFILSTSAIMVVPHTVMSIATSLMSDDFAGINER